MTTLLVLAASYLLGGLPFGYLLTRLAGRGDIREMGSGNPGATNVLREVGTGWGTAVLLLDAAKGAGAVYLAVALGAGPWIRLGAGLAAVLGHSFSPFLRFRGGKGVATGGGVFLSLAPQAMGLTLGVFLITLLLARMVSAASLMAALALPVMVGLTEGWRGSLFGLALLVAMLVWYRHRSNIGRILRGREPRLGRGKSED